MRGLLAEGSLPPGRAVVGSGRRLGGGRYALPETSFPSRGKLFSDLEKLMPPAEKLFREPFRLFSRGARLLSPSPSSFPGACNIP